MRTIPEKIMTTLPTLTESLYDIRLTERETEILSLVAQGYTRIEIADLLFVAQGTVGLHLRAIYAKLGAGNRIQALRRAARLGLIPSLQAA